MTKEEILKKVIKRSTENGFETYPSLGKNAWVGPDTMNGCLMEEIDWEYAMENLNNIIFDHKFAKAFWGTGGRINWVTTTDTHWLCADCGHKKITCETVSPPKEFRDGIHAGCKNGKIWKECLQNMVLYEEPLDYLKKFL